MKLMSTLAFAAAALFAATFATAAPAKADNFGVYVGSNGFGVQVSNYDGYYGGGYDRCRDRWYYKRNRHCWNYGNSGHGYYNGGYPYQNNYYGHRPHRGHWGHNRHRNNHWGHHRGHRGHWGHNRGHRGWGDGHRGHRGHGGHRGHRGGH